MLSILFIESIHYMTLCLLQILPWLTFVVVDLWFPVSFWKSVGSISLCCSFWNKARLGRHRSLNGWVAIRCIPASDLANVIRRVAKMSTVFEFQCSLKFLPYIHGIQCACIYYVEKDNHWQSTSHPWPPTIWSSINSVRRIIILLNYSRFVFTRWIRTHVIVNFT